MTIETLALAVLALVQGAKWASDRMTVPTLRNGGAFALTVVLGPVLALLGWALGAAGDAGWQGSVWTGLGASAYAIAGYNGVAVLFGAFGRRVPLTPPDPLVGAGGQAR